jgi:hypothetical protein
MLTTDVTSQAGCGVPRRRVKFAVSVENLEGRVLLSAFHHHAEHATAGVHDIAQSSSTSQQKTHVRPVSHQAPGGHGISHSRAQHGRSAIGRM